MYKRSALEEAFVKLYDAVQLLLGADEQELAYMVDDVKGLIENSIYDLEEE